MTTDAREAPRGRHVGLAAFGALVVSLAGVVTFGSIVGGFGEWVEGRDLPVVLPWALPALVASAAAAVASLFAVRRCQGTALALVGAAVVAFMLVALVLVNPSIGYPVP